MANTYTPVYNLAKPAQGDLAWDDEINDNMDIIDSALRTISTALETKMPITAYDTNADNRVDSADSATISTTAGSAAVSTNASHADSASISTTAQSATESSNAWKLNSLSGTAYGTLTSSNTWTKNQGTTPVTVEISGTAIATDASLSNVFTITLTANATLSNPTNLKSGSTYLWVVTQDGTGGRLLSYGTKFKWSGKETAVLTTAASSVDLITGLYVSASDTILCTFTADIG